MTNNEEVKKRVYRIVGEVMNIPCTVLNDQLSVENCANWTSLNHMALVLSLEKEFGVTFSYHDIVNKLISLKGILEALNP